MDKVAHYKEEIYKKADEQIQRYLIKSHPLYTDAVKEHAYPKMMRDKQVSTGARGGVAGGVGGALGSKLMRSKRTAPLALAGAGVGAAAGALKGRSDVKGAFAEAGKDYDKTIDRVTGSQEKITDDVGRFLQNLRYKRG